MTSAAPVLGTIPQWITAGTVVSVLIAWWRRGVSLRGLANNDAVDIRDHYAEELKRLVERVDAAEDKHDKCLADRDALRDRLVKVEDELTGVYRLIAQASRDKVLLLGDDVPEHIRAAAVRAGAAIDVNGRKAS
jgi:hypothetical protein